MYFISVSFHHPCDDRHHHRLCCLSDSGVRQSTSILIHRCRRLPLRKGEC